MRRAHWFLLLACLALVGSAAGWWIVNFFIPPTLSLAGLLKVKTPVAVQTLKYAFPPVRENFAAMEKAGLIKSALAMRLALRVASQVKPTKATVKRGVYVFSNVQSSYAILRQLVEGREAQWRFTITEGADSYDLDQQLFEKKIIIKPGSFVHYSRSKPALEKLQRLGLGPAPSLEGYLFPDTYHLTASEGIDTLTDLALNNFITKLTPVYARAQQPRREWHRYLTMASLVEKETRVAAEKPLVAAVLFNRLKKNMKLRFDPTLIYTLKKLGLYQQNLKEGKINLRRRHFGLRSVFNTYYVRGLPPGPIASPDATSLAAVLFPAQSDYLFFVAKSTQDHTLGHDFSRTYEEHLRKIKQYRRRK